MQCTQEGTPDVTQRGSSKGPKIKTPKKSLRLPTKSQNIPGPKITQKKSMPNFQALSISRKQDKFGCTLFAELHSQDTWALPRIFILF